MTAKNESSIMEKTEMIISFLSSIDCTSVRFGLAFYAFLNGFKQSITKAIFCWFQIVLFPMIVVSVFANTEGLVDLPRCFLFIWLTNKK